MILDRLLLASLRDPAWCFDNHGQPFEYLDADLGAQAADEIESLNLRIKELESLMSDLLP